MIERQFHERLAQRRVARIDGELVFGEALAHDARHQLGGPRRELGGLDHHPVACRQRPQRRQHRQLIGIVPRRHHADDAERLGEQAVVPGPVHDLCRDPLRAHPPRQMPLRVLDGLVDGKEVRDQGFVR